MKTIMAFLSLSLKPVAFMLISLYYLSFLEEGRVRFSKQIYSHISFIFYLFQFSIQILFYIVILNLCTSISII